MAQIRIDEARALRIIAQRLRDHGVAPAEANSLAATVTKGLIAATPELNPTNKPWRMIPPHPTPEMIDDIEARMLEWRRMTAPWSNSAQHLWDAVYNHGTDLPER